MKRQSVPRAACHTAFGSLCDNSRAVRPAATTTRAVRAKAPERRALVIFCCRVFLPVSIVGICTGIVAVIIAGPWALVYVPLYVLATAPGWPLGRALFGRHPASWVAGALLGYGLTCLALWAVIALRIASAWTFLIAWAALCAVLWIFVWRRERPPLVQLPPLSIPEARVLILLLLLVPVVFVFPYRNLGAQDGQGNRYYRAYFTADFIWHTALTAELMKYDMPPINPYLGDRTIQYYWTYFLVPAAIAQEGGAGLNDVERVLKINALLSGLLFLAALILTTWSASQSTIGTAIAVMLGVLAVSGEGLYLIWDLVQRGRSIVFVKYFNIDAITAWRFNGLRVDGLVRSMWYNPQHSMSAALGLLAMPIAGTAGVAASAGAIALAGLALALSTTFNPLVGGLFSLVYGFVIVADWLRARDFRQLLRHAIAAAAAVAAVTWCITNDMVEGAAGVVVYGFGGLARNAPIAATALSLGLLLIPALIALWPPTKLPRGAWPGAAGMVIGLLVFFLVRISRDAPYIGFRAGQLLQVTLPGLAAVFFSRVARRSRMAAVVLATLLIAVGLPTTLIDVFNAQDIANHEMGPGFRWTVMLTPEEQQAYRWLRTQTPPKALVAMDPFAHGRETWSQIPTFAWRRMAGGKPISLMAIPDYEIRSRQTQSIYADGSPENAARTARQLGLAYIFVGPEEERVHPHAALAKLDRRPDLFKLVFSNARTRIYEIVRR